MKSDVVYIAQQYDGNRTTRELILTRANSAIYGKFVDTSQDIERITTDGKLNTTACNQLMS
jgi:hypothetical protein